MNSSINRVAAERAGSSIRLSALKKIPAWLYPMLLVLAAPLVLPGYFATPVVFSSCTIRQALVTSSGADFSVDQFEGASTGQVKPGERFCDRELRLGGTAGTAADGLQWRLFNVGDRGEIYLHEPPLALVNGHWHTDNVRPGSNIREIRFVRMSESSSRRFSAMASDNIWQTVSLPQDAQVVASIRLDSVPVCARLDARTCVR